jgi:hypothetical protein
MLTSPRVSDATNDESCRAAAAIISAALHLYASSTRTHVFLIFNLYFCSSVETSVHVSFTLLHTYTACSHLSQWL